MEETQETDLWGLRAPAAAAAPPPRLPPRTLHETHRLVRLLREEPRVAGRFRHAEISELEPGSSGVRMVYGTWYTRNEPLQQAPAQPCTRGRSGTIGATSSQLANRRSMPKVRRALTSDPPAPGPRELAVWLVERLARDWEWVLSVCRVEFAHGDLQYCGSGVGLGRWAAHLTLDGVQQVAGLPPGEGVLILRDALPLPAVGRPPLDRPDWLRELHWPLWLP